MKDKKHFFRPFLVIRTSELRFIPSLDFSFHKTGENMEQDKDSAVSYTHRSLSIGFLAFCVGFSWMTAYADKKFSADDSKAVRRATNFAWRFLLSIAIIVIGLIGSYYDTANKYHFSMVAIAFSFMIMLSLSIDRADHLVEAHNELSSDALEHAFDALKQFGEAKFELAAAERQRELAYERINKLETDIEKLKKKSKAASTKVAKATVSEA